MNEREPIPVEYARPTPGASRPVTSIPLTIVFCTIYAIVAVIAVVAVPRLEDIFKDFRTELPGITKVYLMYCRWFRSGFGWAVLLPLPIALPVLITQLTWSDESRSRQGMSRRWMRLIIVLALGLFVLVTAVAMFAPLISLIQSVSTPGKK